VEARPTRLERATARLGSGEYKKALADLWYVEAEHRADGPGLREALALASLVAARGTGRGVRKDADLLVSILRSDLDRLQESPTPHVHFAPPTQSRLATILGFTAAIALGVAAVLFALAATTFDLSGSATRDKVTAGFFYASIGCAVVFAVATVGWAITALRSAWRARSE
jgi:hypothetical protein